MTARQRAETAWNRIAQIPGYAIDEIERAILAAQSDERERCAKLCELPMFEERERPLLKEMASRIRALPPEDVKP